MRQIFDDADSVPTRSDRYYYNDRWQIMRINTDLAVGTDFSRDFVYGNGIDEPLFMDKITGTGETTQTIRYYYIHDNLGSVVALTDASGAVVESYKYSPWGDPTIYAADGEVLPESAVENPYLFTSREVDILDGGSLKIQKNRHRDYHYQLAIWMQADPRGIVPNDYMNSFNPLGQYGDGFNIYQYVGGQPVNRFDELGLVSAVHGDSGHIGLTVEIKSNNGKSCGFLTADFGLKSYFENEFLTGRMIANSILFGPYGYAYSNLVGPGAIKIGFNPIHNTPSGLRVIDGVDDNVLIDYILDSVGLKRDVLNYACCNNGRLPKEIAKISLYTPRNGFETYNTAIRNCAHYVDAALEAMLGSAWDDSQGELLRPQDVLNQIQNGGLKPTPSIPYTPGANG